MDLLITVRIALRALAKNKLRAGLTVLGVVIGIAAVTAMVSIGQSTSELIQGQIAGLGTNVIVVLPGKNQRGPARQTAVMTLTAQDSEAIEEECPAVLATSPLVAAGSQQIVYGNNNWQPNEMWGVGENYLTVRNWTVRAGSFFTDSDIRSGAQVCAIGQTVVAKLFQTRNPIGKTIRIKNTLFRIIGVLEAKGANLVGQDQDNIVLMPFTTVQNRLQNSIFKNVHAIMVSARTQSRMGDAEDEIRRLLMERHNISLEEQPDFEVRNTTEIANIMGIVTGTVTLLLAAIAGISLLVGGVGIMNIMLVSVTERTREIGIRMALGARGKDILRQFLIESVILSCIGGLIGVLLGIGASVLLVTVINSITSGTKWPLVISFPAAIGGMLFSAAVGIFFGYYPARRASKLDPIQALRYE